ncbi:MAG: ABC transporter permease [Desulfurococcaceae archaeon]
MVLAQLVKREIKAFLKNPAFIGTLILLVVFYAALGGMMRRGIEEAQKAVVETSIGVVLEEDTPLTRELINALNVTLQGRVSLHGSLREAAEKASIGIQIPMGFTANATGSGKISLNSIVKVDSFSTTIIQAKTAVISQIENIIKRILPLVLSAIYGQRPSKEVDVVIRGTALFYNKEVDVYVLTGFFSFILMLPLLVAIVFGSNATYASQLVAFEKAEKAFEMLLAQPIRRSYIVLAKIMGASIATMIFSVIYLVGLFAMFTGMAPTGTIESGQTMASAILSELSRQLGVDLAPHIALSVIISLVLGLLVSGSIGIVLGSLAPDERTAGILTTPVMLLYFGIAFVFMFMGIQLSIPLSIIAGIAVMPIPTIYILSLIVGEFSYVTISITIAVTTCLLLIATSVFLFNRDIVVLGLRLKLKRE